MAEFSTTNLVALLHALAERMRVERDALCALDGLIGDADHGIAMEQGMVAADLAAQALPEGSTLQEMFNAAAKGFLNAVGASSGPLYATGLMRMGKAAGPVTSMPLEDVPLLIAAMAEGIIHRGKAEIGQKTMIDTWAPAAAAVTEARAQGLGLAQVLAEALRAGERGCASTANMQATLGRAARLGERSLGHRDPGAVSALMILEVISDQVLGRRTV